MRSGNFHCILFSLLFCVSTLFGLDRTLSVNDYLFHQWLSEDGLPHDSIYSLTQDHDGYLWAGTDQGLVRFDGEQFSLFTVNDGLPGNLVNAVFCDSKGRLWIGTYDHGIALKDGDSWQIFDTNNGLSHNRVWAIEEDQEGGIWVGVRNGVNRIINGSVSSFSDRDGLPSNWVSSLLTSKNGTIYLGTEGGGVSTYANGTFQKLPIRGETRPGVHVYALAEGKNDALWIGTRSGLFLVQKDGSCEQIGPNYSVKSLHMDENETLWIATELNGLLIYRKDSGFEAMKRKLGNRVLAFYQDKSGAIWIASEGGGLILLRNRHINVYSDVLPSNWVFSVLEAKDNSLWVGTQMGLYHRNGDTEKVYDADNGLTHPVIWSLLETSDGAIWAGTEGRGINRIHNGEITQLTEKDGLSDAWVYAMTEDAQKGVWIGTGSGLNLYQNGSFRVFSSKDGLVHDQIISLAAAQHEGLWIGTDMGLTLYRGGRFQNYGKDDGLENTIIMAIHQDKDGVWLGTSGGLYYFHQGKFTAYTKQDGLFQDTIYNILEDNEQWLWMGTHQGIFKVRKQELLAYDGRQRFGYISYGKTDGMIKTECNGGTSPSSWLAANGQLYFATIAGLVEIKPNHETLQSVPAVIESVIADNKSLPLAEKAALGSKIEKIEFHYTGIDLTTLGAIRFRYQLEGFDQQWIEAGKRRVAYYTNIPPGDYVFRIQVFNKSGVWGDEARFSFSREQSFRESNLFYILIILGTCMVTFLMHRIRLRSIKNHEMELERLVQVKTASLMDANKQLAEMRAQAVEAAHFAGKSELASIVLHNVEGALNGVNLTINALEESSHDLKVDTLKRISELILEHREELKPYFVDDPRGQRVPDALKTLADYMETTQAHLFEEVEELRSKIVGVSQIVKEQLDIQGVEASSEMVLCHDVVEETLLLLEEECQNTGVHFQREIDTVPAVKVVRAKLKDILLKVIRNSLESIESGAGEAKITVRCQKEQDAPFVFIEIEDTGIGVDPENLSHIFTRGMSSKPGHHGLSLYYCSAAIQEMHGRIHAFSEGHNKGARITIELPLLDQEK